VTSSDPGDLHVWAAPPHWQAIDFISDLHLAPELPQTVAAWQHVLQHGTADAVCLLGDVFERWVGDDSRSLPFEQALVGALASAAARRTVCFMAGNRDFLVGPELCAAAGLTALPDPTVLQAWGGRWLLCHGDALCLDDTRYQAFRLQVRSPGWQRAFLARPLDERIAIADQMRRQSQASQADMVSGDLDPEACRQLLRRADARTLIHGHTHRPAVHDLGGDLRRWVLSDWDLDSPKQVPRAEVLRLTPDGRLQRLSPEQACTD
jgi:UDP-2,3-diacylglucosamine hydrolase